MTTILGRHDHRTGAGRRDHLRPDKPTRLRSRAASFATRTGCGMPPMHSALSRSSHPNISAAGRPNVILRSRNLPLRAANFSAKRPIRQWRLRRDESHCLAFIRDVLPARRSPARRQAARRPVRTTHAIQPVARDAAPPLNQALTRGSRSLSSHCRYTDAKLDVWLAAGLRVWNTRRVAAQAASPAPTSPSASPSPSPTPGFSLHAQGANVFVSQGASGPGTCAARSRCSSKTACRSHRCRPTTGLPAPCRRRAMRACSSISSMQTIACAR